MDPAMIRLLGLLRDPATAAGLSPADWNGAIAAARNANLLGTLAERLGQAGVEVACGARRHLQGARLLSARQRDSVHWEVQAIDEALAGLELPVVLLKGAAYAIGGHANGIGRLFGDIDILIPAARLCEVEILLMTNGWSPGKLDAYDQRYYRQWMHELPPMFHVRRGTVLDVHHTILPATARHKPKPQAIIDRARPVPGYATLRVPCVEDLLIHSITHLVHEGELHNAWRDLNDIDSLIAGARAGDDFWTRLVEFTRDHDLAQPVGLGLALAQRFFATPVPAGVLRALGRSGWRHADPVVTLFEMALHAPDDGRLPWPSQLAAGLLYLRSHWLRMPPWLLLPHLARKAAMRFREPVPAAGDGRQAE